MMKGCNTCSYYHIGCWYQRTFNMLYGFCSKLLITINKNCVRADCELFEDKQKG